MPEPTGVHTWTYAAGSWPIVAVGSTWAEVMASPTFNFWRYDLRSTVQNMPPAINGSRYILGRGQVAFDTSRLPAGQIISAWLELCVPMIPQNEMDVTFHAGTWPYPPVTADWFAYEAEPLGVYNTGQWTTATVFITVPLPGLVGQPRSDLVKLTLRGDETTEYPRGALDYPSVMFAWQWVWDGVTYEPASKLHLIIAEPNP